MTQVIRKFVADRVWRENQVAAYASTGTLIFLTSFFWAPTRDFMQVVYAVCFFVPALSVILLRRPSFAQYGGYFTLFALIYSFYAACTSFWSAAPRPFVFGYHLVFLAVWLSGTSWLAWRGNLSAASIFRSLVFVSSICAVVLLAWGVNTEGKLWIGDPLNTRLTGMLGWGVMRNPNTVGYFFGVSSILAYSLWAQQPRHRSGLFLLCVLGLNLLPVLASQSRGAVLSLAIVAIVTFAISWGQPPKKMWLAGLLVLFAVTVLVAFVKLNYPASIPLKQRLTEESFRPQIWSYVLQRGVEDHLFFGKGLEKHARIGIPDGQGKTQYFNHAHNAWVDAFYRTGLIGLLLMSIHMVYVFIQWGRYPHLTPLYLWLLFGCLSSVAANCGFFWILDAQWLNYWVPAGLIGALISAQKNRLETQAIPG